ncbi:hypothetical protein ZHAS_00009367 [Anopheles sinensis]|uniref:Uncharacterized protein n=1 Tax=Anopheles sinensis TaxID=74873 RepID=A0A084VUU1_ANOSI|nr:hypothetical protein ZHAS_00009367 [Anopheles sinensis]
MSSQGLNTSLIDIASPGAASELLIGENCQDNCHGLVGPGNGERPGHYPSRMQVTQLRGVLDLPTPWQHRDGSSPDVPHYRG